MNTEFCDSGRRCAAVFRVLRLFLLAWLSPALLSVWPAGLSGATYLPAGSGTVSDMAETADAADSSSGAERSPKAADSPEPTAGSQAVLATVDGTAVTEGDLELVYRTRGVRGDLKASLRDRYIDDLIDRVLLRRFLAERKVTVSESLLDDRVQRMEKLLDREGLDFDETLASLGYTRATFRDTVAQPMLWNIHARKVITDAAVAAYWKKHRARFDGTRVRASQIVKRIPENATAQQLSELMQQLAGIRRRIVSGEVSFADAAREESDSPSARDGGDIGQFVYRGRMPVELTAVAFALKPGEVSDPFRTRFGMHLLTVDGIVPGDLSLEDARDEIFQTLSRELQKRLIATLRKHADIRKVETK